MNSATIDNMISKHRRILEHRSFDKISDNMLGNMAILMDNQNEEYKRIITESSNAGDVAQFLPVLVPIVRRVYPKLIANHITGVQAMTAPQAALFALTARYTGEGTESITPTNKGQVLVVNGDDLSKLKVSDITGKTNTSATGKVIHIEDNKILVKVNDYNNLFVSGEKFEIDGTEFTITQAFSNEAYFQKLFSNYSGPVSTAEGEALGEDMKTLGLTVERVDAKAKTRKVKGKYTMEMINDLKALHGADAETEIMDILGKEVQMGIDREVVDFVNANTTLRSDVNIQAQGVGRWEIEKLRAISLAIANSAREVGLRNRRGSANVVLVSPKVATALEQIGNFILSPSKSTINAYDSGIDPVLGNFDNRYKVIVDNFATSEYYTALYKGNDKDAGVYFAPYIGLSFVKVVDPSSGQPSVILMTRYDIVGNPLGAENFAESASVLFDGSII